MRNLLAAVEYKARAAGAAVAPEWLNPNKWARQMAPPRPCVGCGGTEALLIKSRAIPDFDVSALSPAVRKAVLDKKNGYCVRCGLFQDFAQVGAVEISAISLLAKDELTSDSTFANYPPPPAAIRSFNERYFARRTQRWADYFDGHGIVVRDALFLRCWFGAAPAFIQGRYGAAVSGLDMAPLCARYTSENVPGYMALGGEINGHLEGEFLKGPPYDAVFIFHVMCHSFDVVRALHQIRDLLRPGGVAIFSSEVQRKPANPFHRLHPSEPQLVSLLRSVFEQVDRIDDCEEGFVAHVNPYSLKGDVPDFIAVKSAASKSAPRR